MRAKNSYKEFSGQEKAAALVLVLGVDFKTKLFAKLKENEIQQLSKTMAELGTITANIIEELFQEFSEKILTAKDLIGNPENTERLLRNVIGGDRGDKIINGLRGSDNATMWEELDGMNEQHLANYLKNEYPQTIAVVLAKLKPSHAGKVMANLPDSLSMEVINRMLDMDAVQKEVFDEIEETLRRELMPTETQFSNRDKHETVAEIINGLDPSTENRLMNLLDEQNREGAEKIRELMFTFDDLTKVNPAGIKTMLRLINKKTLAIALKGASENLKWAFFNNMSERAGQIMHEDIAAMGPIRLGEMDAAQAEILSIAKDLSTKGEISFSNNDSQHELIY